MVSFVILVVLAVIGLAYWSRGKREEEQVLRDISTIVNAMIEKNEKNGKKLRQRRAEVAGQLHRVDERRGTTERLKREGSVN